MHDDKIDLKWEKDTLYINEKELITVKFEILASWMNII